MNIRRPRLTTGLLAASLIVSMGAAIAPAAQASTESSMTSTLLTMINSDRAAVGLVALRFDSRLATLAGERAGFMAGTGQLSHGQEIGEAVRSVGVTPYLAGEAIGDTNATWGVPAVQYIYDLWRGSPQHWALIVSDRFNYIGIGVAYRSESGQTFASLVFAEAPDSSAPAVSITRAGRSGSTLTFAWSGQDGLLQTHTAGLRDFVVNYRVDNGAWKTLRSGTTATSITLSHRPAGHVYTIAVRARDRRLNVSPWAVRSIRVP